ncbi:hypothetical protein PSET11_00796 [Arthrobacter ulcerisalmonis]|uniref:Tetratricopeptide repeat protein n=1 Tax=Arthrobacter ulcerisalmonis TaxID=2483813 RepID=A0A3P5X2H5_9MICC|nr:hypothetical protein [Arthrobacter ulcerisalmonis]VDC21434.1 hypothetical protein PSET11_00796 [Arthrobacter ulcerisalmonis]
MSVGDSGPIYQDTRDLTPFGQPQLWTPVRGLTDTVGGLLSGMLGGRESTPLSVDGEVPRLQRRESRTAKAFHHAVYSSGQPEKLLALTRTYPGWAGVGHLLAGLQAYRNKGFRQASELLRRGLSVRNDDDANHYAQTYLSRVVTRVEVAEKVEVPVLFSEESVLLALSHALREIGRADDALNTLAGLPPSLPTALARSSLALGLGRSGAVIAWTEGLLNEDDLSAALLLVRARALRQEGWLEEAQEAINEILRRRGTALLLRNDAISDRAALLLDASKRNLSPKEWARRQDPAKSRRDIDEVERIRRDHDQRRIWKQEWERLGGDQGNQ